MRFNNPPPPDESTPGRSEFKTIHLRILAHIGDAVYELFVRECMIAQIQNGVLTDTIQSAHAWSIKRASATFQVQLLEQIFDSLIESERQLVKRARNMPVSSGRRSQQTLHRQATGFEALIGHWHLNDTDRLKHFFALLKPTILSGQFPAE